MRQGWWLSGGTPSARRTASRRTELDPPTGCLGWLARRHVHDASQPAPAVRQRPARTAWPAHTQPLPQRPAASNARRHGRFHARLCMTRSGWCWRWLGVEQTVVVAGSQTPRLARRVPGRLRDRTNDARRAVPRRRHRPAHRHRPPRPGARPGAVRPLWRRPQGARRTARLGDGPPPRAGHPHLGGAAAQPLDGATHPRHAAAPLRDRDRRAGRCGHGADQAPRRRVAWRSFQRHEVRWSGPRTPFDRELAGIGCPVLLLAGEHDLIPPARVQAAAAQIPNAGFVLVPGAGHWLPRDAPAAVATQIIGFLPPTG
jgi:pimeloyl-ACP methyl ester carboxylesterase